MVEVQDAVVVHDADGRNARHVDDAPSGVPR
jgi:hypothetical protein